MIFGETIVVSKTSNIHQLVAKNIRKQREFLGISQEKIALTAGLNRAYIGYIERGERKPSVDTLEKIAKALKVKLYQLFIFE
jgi:transcriptional regulator with XRE-family HTH domain